MDDPFAILGLARCFAVNLQDVIKAQTTAVLRCHPDRQLDGIARELAIGKSAKINAAAATLADPLLRAEALIALEDPHGKAVPLGAQQLMELLERRESIEASHDLVVVQQFDQWLQGEQRDTLDRLAAVCAGPTIHWIAARSAAAYLRALMRLADDADRLRQSRTSEHAL